MLKNNKYTRVVAALAVALSTNVALAEDIVWVMDAHGSPVAVPRSVAHEGGFDTSNIAGSYTDVLNAQSLAHGTHNSNKSFNDREVKPVYQGTKNVLKVNGIKLNKDEKNALKQEVRSTALHHTNPEVKNKASRSQQYVSHVKRVGSASDAAKRAVAKKTAQGPALSARKVAASKAPAGNGEMSKAEIKKALEKQLGAKVDPNAKKFTLDKKAAAHAKNSRLVAEGAAKTVTAQSIAVKKAITANQKVDAMEKGFQAAAQLAGNKSSAAKTANIDAFINSALLGSAWMQENGKTVSLEKSAPLVKALDAYRNKANEKGAQAQRLAVTRKLVLGQDLSLQDQALIAKVREGAKAHKRMFSSNDFKSTADNQSQLQRAKSADFAKQLSSTLGGRLPANPTGKKVTLKKATKKAETKQPGAKATTQKTSKVASKLSPEQRAKIEGLFAGRSVKAGQKQPVAKKPEVKKAPAKPFVSTVEAGSVNKNDARKALDNMLKARRM